MTYDRKPDKRRRAMEVAGDLVRRDETEAAVTIRDLIGLAETYRRIDNARRLGREPNQQLIDIVENLSWLIE